MMIREGRLDFVRNFLLLCAQVIFIQFREMWDLINVDDLPGLTVNQLESGMATVTRSEDFFDCFPAVKQAYKTTKDISREPIAEQDNDADDEKSKGSRMLDFEEFKTFLQILRQYYIFCQVRFLDTLIYLSHTME